MRILAAAALALACSSSPPVANKQPSASTACEQARAQLQQAEKLHGSGHLLRALETLERATSACPSVDVSTASKAIVAELALPTAAAPSADEMRDASLLYRDGVRLRLQNNPALAIRRLEQSFALAPHPLTQLQLAEAQSAASRPADARKHIARAVHLAEARSGQRLQPLLASGHGGSVGALALTKNGRTLYSGGDDGMVIAWDMSSGRERWRAPIRRLYKIFTMSLSPDGRHLAVTCDDRVFLLDARTGEVQPPLRLAGGAKQSVHRARSVLYLDNERLAVGFGDGTIEVWRGDKQLGKIAAPERTPVLALSASPNRGKFIAGWSNGYAAVYDAQDLQEQWRERTPSPVRSAVISRDADRAYLALWDGTVAIYDADGKPLASVPASKNGVYALALFDDGRKLAVGVHGFGLRTFDAVSGETLHQIKLRASVRAIATLAHGEVAGIADGTGEIAATNLILGTQTRPMSRGGTSPFTLQFHPLGKQLALRLDDGTAMLWDLETGKPRRLQADDHHVWALAFSRGGNELVTVSREGELIVWDTDSGLQRLRFGDRDVELLCATWSSDGTRIYTGDERGRVAIWDASKGSRLDRLEVHKRWITTIALSPDGGTLATGSLDSEVALIDLATGKQRHRFRHYAELHGARFTRDGTQLVTTGFDGILRVFDVASGELSHERHTNTGHRALAVGPDGTAYAAGHDRRIHRINVSDGTALQGYGDHDGLVLSVAVHPSKPLIASGAFDRTARLWHRDTHRLLAIITVANDGNWVVVTPDARVDSNAADGRTPLLMWKTGPYHLPSWAGWQRGHTPGLLAEIVDQL